MNAWGKRRSVVALAVLGLALAGCQSAAERAAAAMAQGQQLAAAGQYVAAQQQFDLAVAARDDLPELWMLRARNQVALADYAGAFASYRNALDQDRTNREALDALAQLTLASNRIDDAKDYAEQILALAPDDPTATLVVATVAFRTGRYDTAADTVAKLLAQSPDNERALVLSSRLEQRRGRYTQAIALLAPIFDKSGGSDELRKQLTDLYSRQSYATGLLAIARRDAADRPQDKVAQRAFGQRLAMVGQYGEAIAALDGAHKLELGDAERAATVRALADAEASPAALATAASGSGTLQPDLILALAEYAIARGDIASAATILSGPSGPLDTSTADREGALAYIAAATGRIAEARQRAQATLALDAGQPYALMARALAALASNDADAALRDARTVVSDNQQFATGYALLARVLAARGDRMLAEKAFFDANNADRDDPLALRQLAAMLVARGRAADALSYVRSYTIRNPASLAGWTLRQDLCRRTGDAACARRAGSLIARLHGANVVLPPVPADELVGERDYRDEEPDA